MRKHLFTISIGALKPVKTMTGFTLAEVLITLTVIGVIAALTIPSLITNIQDAQYKTAWKRSFSDLNQAVSRVVQNNGGSIKSVCSTGDSDCLRDLFKPYLSYTKSCDKGTNNGNCWLLSTNYLNGTSYTDPTTESGLILNSGAFLRFWVSAGDCSTPVPLSGTPIIYYRCGGIMVDINGFKGPNTWGKDVFRVNVLENRIKPTGIEGDGYFNDCNTSGTGLGCSALYLYQ